MLPRPALLSLLWRRFTLRHAREAPGQTALLVLILGLGVAVTFSIRLANRAATASFRHFTDLVAAESDWILHAPAGDLPESILPELRVRLGTEPVHVVPIVESTATRPPSGARETVGSRATFRILGIDLIGIQNLPPAAEPDAAPSRPGAASGWFGPGSKDAGAEPSDSEAGEARFWEVLRNPASVFISSTFAARDGVRPGDRLPLVLNDRIVPLQVAGVIPDLAGQPAAPPELLVMDLPALQHWTGRTGWLTRVELRVEPGPEAGERRDALRSRLEAWSTAPGPDAGSETPAGAARWRVSSPSERRAAGAVMTRAFRLNLTILSLLALLVGLYLVVQALDGAVVRRRPEIATLRALGVDAAAVRAAWLVESAVYGLAGGVFGVILGWIGAQGSVRLVGRTVNALYYASSADAAHLEPGEMGLALVLALGASLLAGWWPARSAAATPPAQLLARHGGGAPAAWALRHPGLGLALLAAGVAAANLPPVRLDGGGRFPAGGYAAALLWILGASLAGGRILAATARALRPLGRHSAVVRLGLGALTEPSGRHVLATAGLVGAVAMTAGMVILVGSFDRTMRGWIGRTFQADLYVSSAGAQSASTDNRMSPETWRALAADPDVADTNVLHGSEILLPDGTTLLAAGDFGFLQRHVDLAWVEAPRDPEALFARAADPAADPVPALVSESFSERFRLGRGDPLVLPTPTGPRTLRIEGVFADYGNERGSIVVDRGRFSDWFRTSHAASLIVTLRDPAQAEAVRARWLAAHPGLQILTQGHLRSEILRIFRQTFAITDALEAIGLAVAVIGLGMTLASVLLGRRSEWTTLRALGATPAELAGITAIEGTVVAVVGLGIGLAVSGALGWLLIRVINKQTFGWTLEGALPVGPLALLAGLVLAAAAAVSYAVGRWGARLPADREE